MHLVALAWIYVALMMALAEAFSPQGSVLGAVITLMMYGVLPLALVLYLLSAPARRRARASAAAPDQRGLAAGAAVASVREEAQPVVVGAVLAAADGIDAERAQPQACQPGEVGAPARGAVAARLPPET